MAQAAVVACLLLFGWSRPAAADLAARVPFGPFPPGPTVDVFRGLYVRAVEGGPAVYLQSPTDCYYAWHEAVHASDDLGGRWGAWDVSGLLGDPAVGWAAAEAQGDREHANHTMLVALGFRYDLFPRAYADRWFPYANRYRVNLPMVRKAA